MDNVSLGVFGRGIQEKGKREEQERGQGQEPDRKCTARTASAELSPAYTVTLTAGRVDQVSCHSSRMHTLERQSNRARWFESDTAITADIGHEVPKASSATVVDPASLMV